MIVRTIACCFALVTGHALIASENEHETLFGGFSRNAVNTPYSILDPAPFQKYFVITTGAVAGLAGMGLTPMVAPLVVGTFYVKASVVVGSTLLGAGTILMRAMVLNNAFERYKSTITGTKKKEKLALRDLTSEAFLSLFAIPAGISALAVIAWHTGFPV